MIYYISKTYYAWKALRYTDGNDKKLHHLIANELRQIVWYNNDNDTNNDYDDNCNDDNDQDNNDSDSDNDNDNGDNKQL